MSSDYKPLPGAPQPVPPPDASVPVGAPAPSYNRKAWRGGLCECFGDCSAVDFGTCCLVTWVPFVAFGQNMRKAFGMSFIVQMLLVLACLYGAQFFVGVFSAIDCGAPPMAAAPYGGDDSSEADSSDVPAVKSYEACMAKWNIIYLLYIPLTVGFLLYAGYRRNQMRAKFSIPGDEYEDYFFWLCCGPCVLCQETRTMSYHNVEDGTWPEAGERQPMMAKMA